jgi:hypothetical protein
MIEAPKINVDLVVRSTNKNVFSNKFTQVLNSCLKFSLFDQFLKPKTNKKKLSDVNPDFGFDWDSDWDLGSDCDNEDFDVSENSYLNKSPELCAMIACSHEIRNNILTIAINRGMYKSHDVIKWKKEYQRQVRTLFCTETGPLKQKKVPGLDYAPSDSLLTHLVFNDYFNQPLYEKMLP